MSLHLLDKALAYAPKKRVMSVTFAIQYSLINLEKIFTHGIKNCLTTRFLTITKMFVL